MRVEHLVRPGRRLPGNSWRIAGDGTNWGALSNCINQNAALGKYAAPGGWNDPDLLQGTGVGSNDKATNPDGCFDKADIPQANYLAASLGQPVINMQMGQPQQWQGQGPKKPEAAA